MTINREDIQAMFTRTIYNRGRQYYQQARVVEIYQEGENHWHGEVYGSSMYHVEARFDHHSLDLYCDCPAFETYGECKHLVAFLLEVADQMKRNEKLTNQWSVYDEILHPRTPQYRENETANQMIQLFSVLQSMPNQSSNMKREQLKTEYIIRLTGPYLTVEMKVGTGRLYVVKDLKMFIERINRQEEMEFTKNFTYSPAEHEFSREDLEVLQILYDITKSDRFYQSHHLAYHRSSSDRGITVPPFFADQLLDLLQDRNCVVEERRYRLGQLEIVEGEPPFSFHLNRERPDTYVLECNRLKEAEYLSMYKYLRSRNRLFKLTHSQSVIVSELFRIMDRNEDGKITVDRGQIEPFVSHVLPELKKVGDLKMAEAVSEEIIDHPLHPRLYLDYVDGRLKADLEFHYGDIVIHPYHHDSNHGQAADGILMREVEKENEVIHFLEQAEFQINEKELYLEAEEDIFIFLFDMLPDLKEKAEIFLSDQAMKLIRDERHQPRIEVDVDDGEDFLEVNFDMDGISEEEIRDVIQSVVERKTYHRLSDGSFLPLEKDGFVPISRLFSELDLSEHDVKNGTVKLPVYRGIQVEEAMAAGPKTKFKKEFRELIHAIKHPDESDYPLPSGLQAKLRDYQYVGFQWLKGLSRHGLGGILADDMGLGKTLQSIAYLLSEKEEKEHRFQALVVCPSSLVYNWKNEFETFAPGMNVRVISGTKQERENLLKDTSGFDVLVTSYQLLRQDLEYYHGQTFSVMILDEAQAIKNDATKTARAVKSVSAGKRFALSGTPIENSLDELWSIFDAVLPGLFPAKRFFKQWPQEKVSRICRPFILRRVKQDVLHELPEKIEHVHTCELTDDQKKLYLGYLERIQGETKQVLEEEGLQKGRMKILAGLTRLRQLCCHPSLFLENYEGGSGKLTELLELVQHSLENRQRILIFSQFSSMLKKIRKQLEARGKDVFYLDGQTPSKDRVYMTERFNRGEKDIFLISLKAGGTGLNLTGADTVILYDLWWNPAVEDQAAGRAHRMGQKNVVQVFRMITRGTIEEKIHKLQQKKKALIENVIQPGETMLSSLSEEEIKELLEMEN